MNKTITILLTACTATVATGQEAARPGPHHWGLGLPTWMNAKARFSATRATDPGAIGTADDGRVNRYYDDGFNRVNAAGNPALIPGGGPLTTFFGYQNDSQVNNVAGAGTLSLHSLQVQGGDYNRGYNNRPLPGIEAFYRYDWKSGSNWSVDWELAAGYQNFHWKESGSSTTVNLITDTFNLNGVTLAPGAAPFAAVDPPVPGSPAIDSTPARTVSNVAASVAGYREVEMHAIQARLAPTLSWRPSQRWSLGLQGGLALGVGFSRLSFDEDITVAAAGVPVISQQGRSSAEHFWGGLFSAFRVGCRLNEKWTANADIRHLWARKLNHTGAQRSAEISLSEGFGVSGAISYSFR